MSSLKGNEGIPAGAYVHIYLTLPGRTEEVTYVGRWIFTSDYGMVLEYGLGKTFIPWHSIVRIEALFADNPESEASDE